MAMACFGISIAGCGDMSGSKETLQEYSSVNQEILDESMPTESDEHIEVVKEVEVQKSEIIEESVKETICEDCNESRVMNFVDVYGKKYEFSVNPNVKQNQYEADCFQREGQRLEYVGDTRYTYRLGVDVSRYQGNVDWDKVKADGYQFAFVRMGYRGYEEGKLHLDKEFFRNIENAQSAGIDVGVYFFSQAINVEEAIEEAEFVLDNLNNYELQLPIVYDPEHILDKKARTDEVTGNQFTQNAIAFCECIEKAGFEPMIYSNMLWEAYEFDMEQLEKYPFWYADYEELPQTPYHFEFWQYSNTGKVNGVTGVVDLDIQLIWNE